MATNLITLESIGLGQFVRVRGIRVVAPGNSLTLRKKLAKGIGQIRGLAGCEHRGGRDGRP